jgi:hypothetical protein
MDDLSTRMGALLLLTSSTDSLLARVARLLAEVVELIYKQFVLGLFKRLRAKRAIEKRMIYRGWGPGFQGGSLPTTHVGNASRQFRYPERLKVNVLRTLRRLGYITQEEYLTGFRSRSVY